MCQSNLKGGYGSLPHGRRSGTTGHPNPLPLQLTKPPPLTSEVETVPDLSDLCQDCMQGESIEQKARTTYDQPGQQSPGSRLSFGE